MIKKIIARFPNWIGDAVMATPVLSELRSQFPNAHITAMCVHPIGDLLKQDPAIDEIFSFKKGSDSNSIIEKLQIGQYDLGILLTNSFSSAWWFWKGNVERRIGYVGQWRSLLLTDRVPMQKIGQHQVDFYQHLLHPLGISKKTSAPQLYVSKEEESQAMKILYERPVQEGQSIIGINPKAAYGEAKCWPLNRFRLLAMKLVEKPNTVVVFLGDASNAGEIEKICHGLPEKIINLAGVTNLRELTCIIKNCDVFVSNDSGPMHIAAAVNTPLVALFGSTDDAITGPWNQMGAVINKRVNCSPCFRRACPSDFRCMNQITVEEVASKCFERKKTIV